MRVITHAPPILDKSSQCIDRKRMSVWAKTGPMLHRCISFAVVRNPYARFLSAYCFLYDSDKRGCKIDQAAHFVIRSYGDVNAFIRDLPHHMERIVHFLPQHVFICKNETIVIRHVLRYEDLPGCLSVLGLRVNLCHINISNRAPHNLGLTRESIAILRDCYQKDFDLLGYDRDDLSMLVIRED